MKKVLIITYYWPPGASPGVQRWLKFVKYLPQFGWKPIVLTVKNGSYPNTDISLLKDIPSEAKIYRTNTIEPFGFYNMLRGKKGKKVEMGMENVKNPTSYFGMLSNYIRANYFIPDARVGWNWFAIKKAKQICHKENIEVIITTGPPHSTHLIGLDLKMQINLPWVADLRDPWTNIYYNKFLNRTKASKKKDKQLETKVLQTADATIVVSNQMKKEFGNINNQVFTIFNGYDEEDFIESSKIATNYFRLYYIGNFKHNQNIKTLWKVISDLVQSNTDFNEFLRFTIVGNVSKQINKSILEFQLQNHVEITPFVPHKEAIQKMKEANLLYLPIPMAENNKNLITGKTFEYLASRTPILAVGPRDGDAAKIVELCNRTSLIDYQDYEVIKSTLLKHFNYWMHNKKVSKIINNNEHKQFSRKDLTKKLSIILANLTTVKDAKN